MSNNLPNNKLYTIGEISEILGVSIGTLRRWEKKGKLKSVRTLGGHRRYSLESIEAIEARRNFQPTPKTISTAREILVPQSIPVSIKARTIMPIQPEPLYSVPPFRFPFKKIANLGIKGFIIFLLIFFVSRQNLINQAIGLIPENIRSEISQVPDKYGVTKFLNERAAQIEQIANAFRQTFSEAEKQRETGSAVLAESASKDLSFDVNIDSRFRGNLGVDGSATISGTLTVQGIETKGNITGQTITSTGAITGTTGTFTGNITVPGIVTNAPTFNLVNTNATTLNLGGAATTISLGASSGTTTVNNDLKVSGAFTSSGKITASGDVAVSGTLSVSGATALSGNLTKINGVTYSWPTTQGAASTLLSNDGAGNLTWTSSTTNLGSVTGVLAIANGGTNNSTAYTAGSVIFSDGTKLTQDNAQFFWDDTAHQLKIGSGGAVIPSVNLGADLGTTALRWNNIYVGTVNSNSTLSTTGQALFTYTPTDTTYGQSSVQINPTTAPANSFLLGLGIAGAQRAGIDAEGDLTLGYSGGAGTSAPNNANPLSLYNHSTTNIFNVDIVGNLISNAGINWRPTADGTQALNIASASGIPFITIDTTNRRLALGKQTAPTDTLDIFGNATMSGTLGFKAIFSTDVPTCNATAKGKIYFDGQRNQHYFCNGTNWRSLVGLQDQHRRDITTDSLVHNQIVRKGWNYAQGTGATLVTGTGTYGITFDDVPIVTASRASFKTGSAPTALNDCTAGTSYFVEKGAQISGISTTSFSFTVGSSAGAIATTDYMCFTWMAHGTFAAGADLAEYYRSNELLEAGDVVSISKSEDKKINKSKGSYDKNAIGIVSTQPGQVLGDEDGKSTQSDAYPVALAGRVPVKVSLEGGVIERGDPITTSSIPGVGMKATGSGLIIGRAMERFDGKTTVSILPYTGTINKNDPELQELNQGIGKIIVFIDNTWWGDTPSQQNQLSLTIPNINDFSDGDFLLPYVSKKDNTTLALFTKFSDAKQTLLGDETLKLNNLTSQYQAVTTQNQENTSQIVNLQDLIASVSAQLANVESDIQLLKSNQLIATASSSILGTATDSAQLTNLSVLKNTILGDTIVNGKLNVGVITLDNQANSIDAIGILKIQALALDSIQFEGGSIEMDKNGNLKINKGVILGNDQMRGSVTLAANHNTVDIIPTTPWSSLPKSIIITPSFITSSAVTRLEITGATIKVGQTSSQDQKIYWVAIW